MTVECGTVPRGPFAQGLVGPLFIVEPEVDTKLPHSLSRVISATTLHR